ncbi:MAG: transglycosylase SLT domain-containing protein [Gammaproteobacteria bacterium]|nr:transglycosylase SLT domain-containing protein [Gammaproteobacteria bacterium]
MNIVKSMLTSFVLTLVAVLAPAGGVDAAAPVDPELRLLVKKAAQETDSFHDRFDGEVWLADMSRRLTTRVPEAGYRVELLKNVHYEANRAGLAPEVVLSVIDVESNFNQYAISSAGARGLMQVMPFWLKEIGQPGDSLFRLQTNLRLGCTILKYYLDKEKGNLYAALKRYNGTRERDYSLKVDKALRTRWFRQ